MNNSLSPDLEPRTDSVEGQPDALTSTVPENENDNATSEDEGKNILPENDNSTPEPNADPENLQRKIEDYLLASYVRRSKGFYHVDRPDARLSMDELRLALQRVLAGQLVGVEARQKRVQSAIKAVCAEDSPDLSRTLPVWSGGHICRCLTSAPMGQI